MRGVGPEIFRLNFEIELKHWWFRARREILRKLIAQVTPPSPDTLLVDIGCGTGANIGALAEDYACVGMDLSPQAIRLARSRFRKVRFLCGTSPEDLGGALQKARLFLFTDVLEHVADDRGLLAPFIEAAAPGTWFLITVPADMTLWSPHDEHHGHYRRYDKRETRDALARPSRGAGPGILLQLPHVSAGQGRADDQPPAGQDLGRRGYRSADPARPRQPVLGTDLCRRGRCTGRRPPGSPARGLPIRRQPGRNAPQAACHGIVRGDPTVRRVCGSRFRLVCAQNSERPSSMSQCTIVIPCYNEAARLDIRGLRSFARKCPLVRFLFVNDGSSDGTLAVLKRFCESAPERLDLLDLPRNVGKAEAVRQGVLHAMADGTDFVGYWDADLATPLRVIPEMCKLLERNPHLEIVLGSRVRLLGRRIRRRSLRHYLGRLFASAASLVIGLPVYDTQCGAKLFRVTPKVASLFAVPFRTGWIFDVELLARFLAGRSPAERHAAVRAMYEFILPEWRERRRFQSQSPRFLPSGLRPSHDSRVYRRRNRRRTEMRAKECKARSAAAHSP